MVLEIKLQDLLAVRDSLVKGKQELIYKLAEIDIKKSVSYAAIAGKINIDDEFKEKITNRKIITKEIQKIERSLTDINKQIRDLNVQINSNQDNDYIAIKKILREVLNNDQMEAIYAEMQNRRIGLPPTKISIGLDNSINQKQEAEKFRKIAKDALDKLLAARKLLASVMDDGMEKFDKGYFLKVMSPLNKSFPTVNEIIKLKDKNNL